MIRAKALLAYIIPVILVFVGEWNVRAEEDWKGTSVDTQVAFGGLTGLGMVDSSGGFALMATASKKVISRGFVPDLNDSVWIEGMAGPVFLSGATALGYSAHLRWEFVKDPTWTFYALGGAGGNYLSVNGTSRFELFPRFGIGALWNLYAAFQLRGEISHEFTLVGVSFPL